ncbi:MAG: carbonic anhydrase [Pseudomonadota bacterium]
MLELPEHLRTGYKQFRDGRYTEMADRFRKLGTGQSPKTMVIACADSRVDPATIFSAGPGELFVVRNVAALVPPFDHSAGYHGTSAAIEFAVTGLNVSEILVMGHGQCTGIAAALAAAEDRPVGQFIGPWVGLLDGIRDELLERSDILQSSRRQTALERMAIQQSLDNLMTFPFVASAVEEDRLKLSGAWFSIGQGELFWLDWDTGVFERVDA